MTAQRTTYQGVGGGTLCCDATAGADESGVIICTCCDAEVLPTPAPVEPIGDVWGPSADPEAAACADCERPVVWVEDLFAWRHADRQAPACFLVQHVHPDFTGGAR